MKILIIDDNPDIHQDFLKILMVNQETDKKIAQLEDLIFGTPSQAVTLPVFEIDTAIQGEEGVMKIKHAIDQGQPYSLAFVDIRMPPGWDGIETIKHIWEIDNNIQVVICTAYSDYSWEETVAALGERDNLLILKKPFDNITVRQLACALTKKWQLTQDAKIYTNSLEHHVKKRTEQLKHQATHDVLTGLPNRILINECLQKSIDQSQDEQTQFSVLFIDLDRFKLINDSLSHEAGDEMLRTVAHAFEALLEKGDMLGRLGGDEFVIVTHADSAKRFVQDLAVNCLSVFDAAFHIEGHSVTLSASIGIATYPTDGDNKDDLIRNADRAMYHAKSLGANQFQYYSQELDKRNLQRLEKEAELRQALVNREFFLEYQPQINLQTEKLVSVEALIRWNHPTKGIVLPMDFIPLAEDTGLIVPLGEWIIRTACQQAKTWQKKGLPFIRVAVNITSKQIRLFNFTETIKEILQETALEPQYLELELTENIIINNIDIVKNLHELKEVGVQIALDDFGTGFSGLGYLRGVPIDRIKIDQSYVKNIESDRGDDVIIEAILSMAKTMNLQVLAEGVETESQLNFLKSKNCGDVQGFYFSKPVSVEQFEILLAKMTTKIE